MVPEKSVSAISSFIFPMTAPGWRAVGSSGPPFGPLGEWGFAQSLAVDVLEADPEAVGFEEVVGVPTIHLRVVADKGSADLWVDASGLVMKLITEFGEEGSSLRFQTVWEVIGLDVELEEPLPPGA